MSGICAIVCTAIVNHNWKTVMLKESATKLQPCSEGSVNNTNSITSNNSNTNNMASVEKTQPLARMSDNRSPNL